MQRHYLLPRQLLSERCFGTMLDTLGRERVGFDDFRQNGLLLPACEEATLRTAMPLHRGPHRDYNEMVIERVGAIERSWSAARCKSGDSASVQALTRLSLVQRALRRRLLDPAGRFFALNRRDPLACGIDFSEIDAMVDLLWSDTGEVIDRV